MPTTKPETTPRAVTTKKIVLTEKPKATTKVETVPKPVTGKNIKLSSTNSILNFYFYL